MALALSSALHAGIIFLTTTGQGAKIQGKPSLNEIQVSIKDVATPANVIPQLQGQSASEPGGVVLVNEEPYYKIKELDVVPQPISSITPRYPESVPSSIRRGVVKLEIKLDEDGLVTEVTVLGSQPPGYFEEAAKKAFIDAKFTPAIKDGKHVKCLLNIQVQFSDDLPSL